MLLRIQIIATGEFLVLGSDGSMPMELNTTLFNDTDDLLASKSYPFSFPLVPNKAIIKNAHMMLADAKQRKLRVRAWINEYPWQVGDLPYTIENGMINANLYVDMSLYVNRLKTLTIDQLADPLIDDQLSFDTIDDFNDYMVSTTTAAPGTMPMVFYPFKNGGAYKTIDTASYADYPDINFPVNPYWNAYMVAGDGTASFLVNDDPGAVSQTQSPAFYLVYILKRIARYLDLKPVGDWLDEEMANRIVIQSMIPNLIWGIIANYYYYMPKMLLTDFIKAMRTKAGIVIDINQVDKIMLIESLVNLEKNSNIIDLRKYQLSHDIGFRETGEAPDAIIITETADDKDAAYTDSEKEALPTLIIGDPETAVQESDIPLPTVVTKMITEIAPAYPGHSDTVFPIISNWRIPMASQPILGATPLDQISSLAPEDERSFKLRLLIYYGLQPDDSGLHTYPYASADNLNKDNTKIADYSLALNASSTSFLAVRHRYNYMYNSKPAEIDFDLPPYILLSIKANCRILVNDFNMAPVYCLWAKCAFDIWDKQQIQTKFTLWPKTLPTNAGEILPITPPTPPPDNGLVYVQLDQRNIVFFDEPFPLPAKHGSRCDIWATFWEDAGATIPKDVIELPLRLHIAESIDFADPSITVLDISATSVAGELELYPTAPLDILTVGDGGTHSVYTYTLLASAFYNVIV